MDNIVQKMKLLNSIPPDQRTTVIDIGGKPTRVKESLARQLVRNDVGVVYDIPYIENLIRNDYWTFDLRQWPDQEFSERTAKMIYDSDPNVPYMHHFGYVVKNWKLLGGTFESFWGLLQEVAPHHFRRCLRVWEDDVRQDRKWLFEEAASTDTSAPDLTKGLDRVRAYQGNCRYAIDEANRYRKLLGLPLRREPKWLQWSPEKTIIYSNAHRIKWLIKERDILLQRQKAKKREGRWGCKYIDEKGLWFRRGEPGGFDAWWKKGDYLQKHTRSYDEEKEQKRIDEIPKVIELHKARILWLKSMTKAYTDKVIIAKVLKSRRGAIFRGE
jgi:hypothetical protein